MMATIIAKHVWDHDHEKVKMCNCEHYVHNIA